MKKHRLREEKVCLNCGAQVAEKFCSHCGQENREPEETFGDLVNHFFADITHYDSKFFISLKDLLFRPGFLTREYLAGRRARYLNPVRMYVFISFTFFLVYFTFYTGGVNISKSSYTPDIPATLPVAHYRDSVMKAALARIPDSTSRVKFRKAATGGINISFDEIAKFQNGAEFDSAQRALPASGRMGKIPAYFVRKLILIRQRYGLLWKSMLVDNFQHNLPKMLFFMLPLFALLLKLFYKWKKYNYVDHAIFSIHFHSFGFLLLLADFILDSIFHGTFFKGISFLVLLVYLVIALRYAYQQSTFLSLVKACVIGFLYSFVMMIALTFTAIYTFIAV